MVCPQVIECYSLPPSLRRGTQSDRRRFLEDEGRGTHVFDWDADGDQLLQQAPLSPFRHFTMVCELAGWCISVVLVPVGIPLVLWSCGWMISLLFCAAVLWACVAPTSFYWVRAQPAHALPWRSLTNPHA